MSRLCADCGENPTTKKWCKPCGYKNRTRPIGLKYQIKAVNRAWYKFKGGCIDEHGYIKIKNRRHHRTVAEEMLGRPLAHNEVVHHINGIKTDNRPENLQVISKQEHDAYHMGKARQGVVHA